MLGYTGSVHDIDTHCITGEYFSFMLEAKLERGLCS